MKRPLAAFAAYCLDAAGADKLRRDHLEAHLDHVESVMEQLLMAGPLKDAAGGFVGSLIVFGVDSEAEAAALLEADPYYQAGIWSEVRIERFLPVAGTLIGGRNW